MSLLYAAVLFSTYCVTQSLGDSDADIVRQIAVLYRVTELAVHAVSGRSTASRSTRSSLVDLSSRCYQEMFAAQVARQQGLVSTTNEVLLSLSLVPGRVVSSNTNFESLALGVRSLALAWLWH